MVASSTEFLKNRSAIDDRYGLTDVHIDDSIAPGRRRYGLWKVPAIRSLPELPLKQGTYQRYTVSMSDLGRLDKVAYLFYRDVYLWWVIAYYNGIVNQLTDMSIGDVLLIPNKNLIIQATEEKRTFV